MANPQMDQSKMLKPPSIDFHEVRPRVVLGLTRQELFKIKIVGIVLNGLASLIFFMIFNYITVRAYALKFFDNFPLNDLTIFSMLMFSFFTRVVSFFSLIFENEKALRLGLVMASMNFIFATLFLFGIGGDGWFGEAAFYHDPNVNMHFLTHYFFDIANPPTLFSMRLQIAEYGEITLR